MHSFIVSADMDIGDGNEVMFVDRALPDLTVAGNSQITFKARKDALSTFTEKGPFTVSSSTNKINPRVRGATEWQSR